MTWFRGFSLWQCREVHSGVTAIGIFMMELTRFAIHPRARTYSTTQAATASFFNVSGWAGPPPLNRAQLEHST